jgi:porphobilinogen synthase
MTIFENTISSFPNTRLRRNRSSKWIRNMIAEYKVSAHDLVLPLFVQEGVSIKTEIKSMPDISRLSIDLIIDKVKEAYDLSIPAVALFPVIAADKKTQCAKEAYNKNNLICRTVSAIKEKIPDIGVICDVALDPYTTHGQDGLVVDGKIVNDMTVDILCKQANSLAAAGADIVAPSDMMDGRVIKIREALDGNGYEDVKILSYAAKYASCFYGPFREAVGSAVNLQGADKKTYQMDPANNAEAMREVALDISEGADMVMIKPAMPYLDIVRQIKDCFNIPIFVYQVSGEYSMIKAAANNGWLDEKLAFDESMLAFKRAGASGIFTYAAIQIAKNIKD